MDIKKHTIQTAIQSVLYLITAILALVICQIHGYPVTEGLAAAFALFLIVWAAPEGSLPPLEEVKPPGQTLAIHDCQTCPMANRFTVDELKERAIGFDFRVNQRYHESWRGGRVADPI